MKKQNVYIGVSLVLIALVGLVFWGSRSLPEVESSKATEEIQAESGIVYFYSQSCSHCAKVQAFLEENNIDQTVSFVKKEISNSANAAEFGEKAEECSIAENQRGVPMLYSEGKCFLGDSQVIGFFQEKAGLNQEN